MYCIRLAHTLGIAYFEAFRLNVISRMALEFNWFGRCEYLLIIRWNKWVFVEAVDKTMCWYENRGERVKNVFDFRIKYFVDWCKHEESCWVGRVSDWASPNGVRYICWELFRCAAADQPVRTKCAFWNCNWFLYIELWDRSFDSIWREPTASAMLSECHERVGGSRWSETVRPYLLFD